LIRVEHISQGTLDTILVHPAKSSNPPLRRTPRPWFWLTTIRAGIQRPARRTSKITRDLIRAGQLLKIEVLDHVIIGHATQERPKDYVSLRELGYSVYKNHTPELIYVFPT